MRSIPLLIENGHTVTGTTRSEAKAGELRALGANAQVMDGLDAASVKAAVEAARPDVIVHQMTALTGIDMKNIDKAFALTNRLRTEGTEHLLAAAHGHAARSPSPSPAGRTRAPAGRSRPRPTRSTPNRRRASARPTPRSAGSRR